MKPKTFLAVYRGLTIASAELVAVTADPEIVSWVASRLLTQKTGPDDPILETLARGRRDALRAISGESSDEHRQQFSIISSSPTAKHGEEDKDGEDVVR